MSPTSGWHDSRSTTPLEAPATEGANNSESPLRSASGLAATDALGCGHAAPASHPPVSRSGPSRARRRRNRRSSRGLPSCCRQVCLLASSPVTDRIALSPRGTHLAFAATDQLYLQAMNQIESDPDSTDGWGERTVLLPRRAMGRVLG